MTSSGKCLKGYTGEVGIQPGQRQQCLAEVVGHII